MRSTRGTPCLRGYGARTPRTDRLPVAREAEPQAVELNQNPRLRTRILSFRHPLIERNYAIGAAILADLDHQTDRSLQATVGQARIQGEVLLAEIGEQHVRVDQIRQLMAFGEPFVADRPYKREI